MVRARTNNSGGGVDRRNRWAGIACGLVTALGLASTAPAALSPIGSGETILFSEDFNNGNANSWTNIAAGTPANKQAFIGEDPSTNVAGDVWYPANDPEASGATEAMTRDTGSTKTFAAAGRPSLANGPLAFYMRVRVDRNPDAANAFRNEFFINLLEQGTDRYASLRISPGGSSSIAYRNTGGSNTSTSIGTVIMPAADTFADFRLVATLNSGGGSMSLEAFRYDAVNSAWASYGVTGTADLNATGAFNTITIQNANRPGAANRAYFDSVTVTQLSTVPEPSSLAIVGMVAGALVVRRRSR